MLATFNDTWDWTAVGTLALAVTTGVSLAFGWGSLRQTQREIEVSRQEVEEAYRPVLVPLSDSRHMELAGTGVPEIIHAHPLVRNGVLYIPIENIGSGPAIRIWAEVYKPKFLAFGTTSGDKAGEGKLVSATGLGTSSRIMLEIQIEGISETPDFLVLLKYSDVGGKGWESKASYDADHARYQSISISGPTTGIGSALSPLTAFYDEFLTD